MAEGDPSWLSRLAASRRLPLYVVLAGLLVSLPALWGGLVADDFVHRALMAEIVPDVERGPTELYQFVRDDPDEVAVMRDLGSLPWFTGQGLVVRFFRPLPSALLVLEYRLLGDTLWPARLHTLVWLAALLLLATALLRRLLSPRAAAVAALVYALSVIHATTVSWLAARYALIAATVGLASLWAHLRAREDGWRPGLVLAPALLLLAYLCGELALAAAAMIAGYELCAGPGGWRRRAGAVLPALVITLGYVAWYGAAGYGAHGSGIYVDPLNAPWRFLQRAALRVPALLGNLVAEVPAELSFKLPDAARPLAAIGLLATAGLGAAAWALRCRLAASERRSLVWLLLAAGASTLAFAGGVPGGRMLEIPMLAGAALIGTVLAHAWPAGAEARRWSFAGALVWRSLAVVLVLIHFGIGPLFRVGIELSLAEQGRETERIAGTIDAPCAPDVYVVAASDPTLFFYTPLAAALDGKPIPRSLRVLSMAPQSHRIENIGETSFDLVVVGRRRLGSWEQIFRSRALRAGDRVELPGLSIRVDQVDRGWPVRLHLDFGRPLTSPDLCFLGYRDGALTELARPRPGQTIGLPWQVGPGGM